MPRMTLAQYARHRNLSKPRITQLMKKGKLALHGGMIDSDLSDQILDGRKRTSQTKFTKAGIAETAPKEALSSKKRLSYDDARTALTAYNAQMRGLQLEIKKGNYLPKEQVMREAFEVGRKTRDSFMSLPDCIGPILAAEIAAVIDNVLEPLDAAINACNNGTATKEDLSAAMKDFRKKKVSHELADGVNVKNLLKREIEIILADLSRDLKQEIGGTQNGETHYS